MKNITVGVAADLPSVAPWSFALDIAAGCKARLHAVLINDALSRGVPVMATGDVMAEWLERFREVWKDQADEVVQRIRTEAKHRHVALDVIRHEGRVVDHLLEAGKDSNLMVVGRGRNSSEHPGSLGSRGELLARRCTSALFMSPSEYRKPRRVVAAYAAKSLGDRVLDLAEELARALDTNLVVLTAGDDPDRIRSIQQKARERLSNSPVEVDFVATAGEPEEVIPAGVGLEDVLVLGPHGRSPMYRMLLGRVTDHVIRAVRGPWVMTTREER